MKKEFLSKKLLTERETAQYLNVSASWLRCSRAERNPSSPPFIRLGRAIRYDVDLLNLFLKEREVRFK